MSLTVQSEVGQLRQVIVHRPGLELSRLTPQNIGDLLFDDVMWAARAKEEHDVFAEMLRDRGVRVYYFGQLLAETLEVPEGRAYVLDRTCTREMLGPELVDPIRRLTDDADAATLASYLVGGVLKADLRPLAAKRRPGPVAALPVRRPGGADAGHDRVLARPGPEPRAA